MPSPPKLFGPTAPSPSEVSLNVNFEPSFSALPTTSSPCHCFLRFSRQPVTFGPCHCGSATCRLSRQPAAATPDAQPHALAFCSPDPFLSLSSIARVDSHSPNARMRSEVRIFTSHPDPSTEADQPLHSPYERPHALEFSPSTRILSLIPITQVGSHSLTTKTRGK